MSFAISTLSNVLANIVFWLGLGLVFWGVSKAAQRRFTRFFGINHSGHVTVWLSNLWIPGPSRRPIGFTISKHELMAAQSIGKLFSAAPMRLPEIVRGLVDALWLRNQIRCKVEVSPPDPVTPIASSTSIVVGASARNSIRRQFINQGTVSAMLSHELPESRPVSRDELCDIVLQRKNGEIQRVSSGLNVCIIEKAILPGDGGTVFFCAGQRADNSWEAAEYLVRHWKGLEREYGDNPFVLGLGFPKLDSYLKEYVEPELLIGLMM